MADVFRVQADIASKVAEAMRVAVGGGDTARLVEVPTRDPAAYDAFLKGDAMYWSGGNAPANVRRSIAQYEQAVRLDTGYALAWAALARARSLLYANSVPTPELARAARAAADRAVQLAPTAAFAHAALGLYFRNVEGDVARSLAEIETARTATPNDPELLSRLAGVYVPLGRFDDAVRTARSAEELNPRSAAPVLQRYTALLRLRRYPEAREAADRILSLASPNVSTIQMRMMVSLGEGDLPGARRILRDLGSRLNEDEMLAYMGTYQDLGWVLDDAGQQRLLSLEPNLFDDDRATWALVRAYVYGLRGNPSLARVWGDSAAREFARQLRASPDNPQLHTLNGLALAYAGRGREAVAEGERGTALLPIERDALNGPYMQHQLVRVHLVLGENEKALDLLEPLLARPYYLSPGWLRIDPTFAQLKGNPRFEKLIAGR
jgi:tetratricopeptide (TPR) repeat protein